MPGVILYDNILREATIDSEATITNYGIANALDGRTATQAGFLNGANRDVYFSFASARTVTAWGVARHNLGSTSATYTIYGSTDNWTTSTLLATGSLSDDSVYINTGLDASYQYYLFRVNPGSADAYIGDLFMGQYLELERSQNFGFKKPDFADGDQVMANLTRGQNLAGLTVHQTPKRVKFDLDYYTASFFNNWADLVATMKLYPVYIRWDTNAQPFYCWPTKGIPEPEYSKNISGYYNVSMDMTGITQ